MSLTEVSLNTLVNFTTTDPDEIEIMSKIRTIDIKDAIIIDRDR